MASQQHPNELKERNTLQIYTPTTDLVSEFWRDKYEVDAKKYWDIFYKRNADKFFKDRHYLDKEWGSYFQNLAAQTAPPCNKNRECMPSSILSQKKVVLEIGCGTGNTVFPLLATYPNIFVYACDFSPRAVNLLKAHKDHKENRIHAFVCDVTCEDMTCVIPVDSVDVATLVFTLSTVSPNKMLQVLQNIRNVLKPNGHILVRDYAVGDLSQERFSTKMQKISQDFYVRGDGTRVFYFSEATLKDLFMQGGFLCENIKVVEKRVENRAREIVMDRRWIQGVFCLVDACGSSGNGFGCPGISQSQLYNSTEGLVDLSEGVAVDMFGVPGLEMMVIEVGGYSFNVKCLPKENQHRFKATGFMLWESALVLATLLTKNKAAVTSKTVLELGCGSVGICSIITAMVADLVVATDGDADALALLSENVKGNNQLITSGNLFTEPLKWGFTEQIQQVKERTNGRGFDIIIGSDVTYLAEAIPHLFATAKALIAEPKTESLVLLCHVVRRVDEIYIINVASKYGFNLEDKWPQDGFKRRLCSSPSVLPSIFPYGLDEISEMYSSVQILCFREMPVIIEEPYTSDTSLACLANK